MSDILKKSANPLFNGKPLGLAKMLIKGIAIEQIKCQPFFRTKK